jgi:hypothetical protein
MANKVFIGAQCPGNQLTDKGYGAVIAGAGASIPGAVIPLAGIVVVGNDNDLVIEQFWGSYLGTAATTPLPCIWLQPLSSGNRVTALKYGSPPQGADVCMQVLDEGSNVVPGLERCRRR